MLVAFARCLRLRLRPAAFFRAVAVAVLPHKQTAKGGYIYLRYISPLRLCGCGCVRSTACGRICGRSRSRAFGRVAVAFGWGGSGRGAGAGWIFVKFPRITYFVIGGRSASVLPCPSALSIPQFRGHSCDNPVTIRAISFFLRGFSRFPSLFRGFQTLTLVFRSFFRRRSSLRSHPPMGA